MKLLTNSSQIGATLGVHNVEHFSSDDLKRLWFSHEDYAVAIVDVDALGGVYAPRILRKNETNVPVIGLTEDLVYEEDWTDVKTIFIEQGGDYLLRSPVNTRELIACITAVIRRDGRIRPLVHLFEKRLVINTSEGFVLYDKKPVHFTAHEIGVLVELALHYGQSRSKEQISNSLYGMDQPELKIIDVYICKIRRKLQVLHPDLSEVIETVWGRGYVLRDRKVSEVCEVS